MIVERKVELCRPLTETSEIGVLFRNEAALAEWRLKKAMERQKTPYAVIELDNGTVLYSFSIKQLNKQRDEHFGFIRREVVYGTSN